MTSYAYRRFECEHLFCIESNRKITKPGVSAITTRFSLKSSLAYRYSNVRAAAPQGFAVEPSTDFPSFLVIGGSNVWSLASSGLSFFDGGGGAASSPIKSSTDRTISCRLGRGLEQCDGGNADSFCSSSSFCCCEGGSSCDGGAFAFTCPGAAKMLSSMSWRMGRPSSSVHLAMSTRGTVWRAATTIYVHLCI